VTEELPLRFQVPYPARHTILSTPTYSSILIHKFPPFLAGGATLVFEVELLDIERSDEL
jgi:hypothetical protein